MKSRMELKNYRSSLKDNVGYTVFTIYTKPHACGGQCRFCFTDIKMPKSALHHEDTERGLQCSWDSYCQIDKHFNRFDINLGNGGKYGINIMGGSFTNYPKEYLAHYVKGIYDFFNGFTSTTLRKAIDCHRNAKDKLVMLCIQTLPNLIDESWCDFMKVLGITEVQIGVETINRKTLILNKRPHSKKDVINATLLLKSCGFAITYHMMIGLIGANLEDEIREVIEVSNNKDFSPDYLKIYPCLAVNDAKHNSPIEKWFELGWQPLDDKTALYALSKIMRKIPRYVGVNRIQRLVPENQIKYGPKKEIEMQLFRNHSMSIWLRSELSSKVV